MILAYSRKYIDQSDNLKSDTKQGKNLVVNWDFAIWRGNYFTAVLIFKPLAKHYSMAWAHKNHMQHSIQTTKCGSYKTYSIHEARFVPWYSTGCKKWVLFTFGLHERDKWQSRSRAKNESSLYYKCWLCLLQVLTSFANILNPDKGTKILTILVGSSILR